VSTIKIKGDDALVIELPGLAAIRIDPAARVVAVDSISGQAGPGGLGREWKVLDLRDGTYGDFHRLTLAEQCLDRDCISGGEHLIAQEG
jgi:hypothetical protein